MSKVSTYGTTDAYGNNLAAPNGAPKNQTFINSVTDIFRNMQAAIKNMYLDQGWVEFSSGTAPTSVWGDTTADYQITSVARTGANQCTVTTSPQFDLSGLFPVNKRLRLRGTTPFTVYGYVTSTSYAAGVTTINHTLDSGATDLTLNSISYGLDLNITPLISLFNITQSGATNGQVPSWNGTNWVPSSYIGFSPNAKVGLVTVFSSGTVLGVKQGYCSARNPSTFATKGMLFYDSNTTFTKSVATTFVAGSGNGGLDTGTVSATPTTYHLFAIGKSADSTAFDLLYSLSPTSPTLPATWDICRRICSRKWSGSAFASYTQTGNYFEETTVNNDFTTVGASSENTVTVANLPAGIIVGANYAIASNASGSAGDTSVKLYGAAVSTDTVNGDSMSTRVSGTALAGNGTQKIVNTNTSAQIKYRVVGNATNTFGACYGYYDYFEEV